MGARSLWQLCRRSWRRCGTSQRLQIPVAWSVELACYRRYQRIL
ncbi:uncharacterized protein DMAD_12323 [Drosophila madeirensis]|uniref:Uncharacterized protein n=1 Tax=Drosophila madeirensis TaxID=30013 RepID=A0AAU9FGM9_DROMD